LNRRDLLLLGATAVAWPLAARAQQTVLSVVGWLGANSSGLTQPDIAAFNAGLAETGHIEGQNFRIEYRWAEGRNERLPALAAELVERKVDVIVAIGATGQALAAKAASSTIPIVFVIGTDPVELGLVASLSRPGGNMTGFTVLGRALNAKRLELLSELVPQARVVALLINQTNGGAPKSVEALAPEAREVARTRGLQLLLLRAATADEIDAVFNTLSQSRVDAILVTADPFLASRQQQLITLAARQAVPAMYVSRDFVDGGGLVSYGPSDASLFHDAAVYVGKILNGEKPADLPVQQPTIFDLAINLTTAKALGLTVPQLLLTQADEVIE
jgi:putative ABC transport system substrate-binding protein